MAAYNKELRDSTGTNIIYPLIKAVNVYMEDNTTLQASMPTVTLNGTKTTTVGIYAPIDSGTKGQVLTSNGNGVPVWAAASTGPDIQVSSTEPSNQKSGDFCYHIV